jgi:hypothetical protein
MMLLQSDQGFACSWGLGRRIPWPGCGGTTMRWQSQMMTLGTSSLDSVKRSGNIYLRAANGIREYSHGVRHR